MKTTPEFDGPIPGENYTSETKNYPWHRPPDLAGVQEVVESAMERMSQPEQSSIILSGLEAGGTILDFVSYAMLSGVGKGRTSIDTAILAAGPIARYIEAMANAEGITPDKGWKTEPNIVTKTDVELSLGRLPKEEDVDEEDTPDDEPATGLMAASSKDTASPDTQMAMLGYSDEDEEAPV